MRPGLPRLCKVCPPAWSSIRSLANSSLAAALPGAAPDAVWQGDVSRGSSSRSPSGIVLWSYHACRRSTIHRTGPGHPGRPRLQRTETPTLRHPRDASAWAWRSAPASLRAAGPGALCRVSPRHRAVAGPTCRPSDRGRTAAARARPGHLRATCRARHTTICRTTSRQPARFKANKAFGRAIDG